jgi:hypothetical protein
VSGLYGVYDVKGVISGLGGGSLLQTLRGMFIKISATPGNLTR